MEGVRTEIELVGLPVDIASRAVIETEFSGLARILGKAKSSHRNIIPLQLELDEFLDAAREHLEGILEERRTEASEDNLYRVDSRIAALTRAAKIRIGKFQQQMDNHIANRKSEGKDPDENYLRLTKARMEKEDLRLHSRIEELQERKVLTLDYNLAGIAFLRIQRD